MLLLLTHFEQDVITLVKEYTLREIGSMYSCSKKIIKKALKSARRKLKCIKL